MKHTPRLYLRKIIFMKTFIFKLTQGGVQEGFWEHIEEYGEKFSDIW